MSYLWSEPLEARSRRAGEGWPKDRRTAATSSRCDAVSPPMTAGLPDLGGYHKNVDLSGQDGFILDDSGGEAICSVAVPDASAIVQGRQGLVPRPVSDRRRFGGLSQFLSQFGVSG
jgi:hypothetical protein